MSKIKVVFIIWFLLTALSIRFYTTFQSQNKLKDGETVSFETTLLDQPRSISRFQAFSVIVKSNKVFIYAPAYPSLNYGDSIRIIGRVKMRVINNEKTVISIYSDKVELTKNPTNFILAPLALIRQKLILSFEKTLPDISSTLLLGIVFGIKGEFPKEFQKYLQTVGVLHIIAASGMNVTMVAFFTSSILVGVIKRRYAIGFSIVIVWLYSLLSGFQPSIIRAATMATIATVAQIAGKQNLALYSTILTCYVILFWSPLLLFDIGFQLSFASTIGLILLPPIFTRNVLISKAIAKLKILEDGLVTICSQIITLPIIFANFGSYSVWSILVNILVLWTVPVLMLLGGVCALFMFVLPFIGQLGLYLCLPFLLYIEFMVRFFGERGGVLKVAFVPPTLIAAYYLFLAVFIIWFSPKKDHEES